MTKASKTGAQARSSEAQIGQEADRWAVRLGEGPLSAQEARAFNQWIAVDPNHERHFQAAQTGLRDLTHVRGLEAYDDWMRPTAYERFAERLARVRTHIGAALKPGWRWAAGGAGALAACAALWVLAPVLAPEGAIPVEPDIVVAQAPDFATAIAEIREVDLPDGSRVTLGAASSLDVVFSETERRVVLAEGEAFFDVEGDPDWPFIVVAGDTLVRVVGTQFDVHRGADAVEVAVLEGEVEVIQPEGPPDAPIAARDVRHVLIAGQQVAASAQGRVEPVRPVDADAVASWRRGELMWADTPVRDIIADLNRYAPAGVQLQANDLEALEYTLAVRADDLDGAVSLLAASLGLEVTRQSNGAIILHHPEI